MKRALVFLSTCALVVGCSDSSESSESIEVVVDTFNVALAGAFIPYESERRQPIVEAIAASDSDIVCLQEVWNQADKELIRDGALEAY
jgi:endonuclease/exonuclease/phosphatase family metal-dependent hydrolase